MTWRVPRVVVAGIDDAAAWLGSMSEPAVVVFDVDNTIVPQGAPEADVAAAVAAMLADLRTITQVMDAVALTNGPRRGAERTISRADKPWTSRRRLGALATAPVVVIGDQVLTDGLLAWRWRAPFVHLVFDPGRETARQRIMRLIGALVTPLLFEDETWPSTT